jgi:hypothetical protein
MFPAASPVRRSRPSAAATNLGTLSVGSANLTATGAVTQSGVH